MTRVGVAAETALLHEVVEGAYQAARARTTRILTFDERHFRSVRPLWGEAFDLLPADRD